MLDILRRICDTGGRLLGVTRALFEGDPTFVTALAFRFEGATVAFRAMSDDDTLDCVAGDLVAELWETTADASGARPWSACVGLSAAWIWQLTNQQGYTDGVRMEFGEPTRPVIVELLVIASAIRLFTATEAGV
jgi:Family of unknown function (DUF6334)